MKSLKTDGNALSPADLDRLSGAKRIGIMGGTFDPIHNGHLAAAESARAELGLDLVIFIPAGTPAFKRDKPVTDGEARYEMARLATQSNPAFYVSRIELDRAGVTYTVDTMRLLRKSCPTAGFIFITGADAFENVFKWKDAGAIFGLTAFAVAKRPGSDGKKLRAALEEARAQGARIRRLDMPAMDVSSSSLRSRAAAGLPIRYLSPDAVIDYIEMTGLYAGEQVMSLNEMLKRIRTTQSQKRFAHTLSVAEECKRLAHIHGVDEDKAYLTGALHDTAKGLTYDKLIARARRYNICADDVAAKRMNLLHAPVGAEIVKNLFGINDDDVLNAIRYHTTGRPGMSKLEKIVFVADFIDPGRLGRDDIETVRAAADANLDQAVILVLKEKISYNKSKDLHPLSKEALDFMENDPLKKREDK